MSQAKNAQLSKESWILAAMDALEDGGVTKVNVEGLARALGVTKGSFYWHFKDRQHLLDELLDYWAKAMTHSVLETGRQFSGDPVERIHVVAKDIVSHERAKLDPHIRAWSQYDRRAHKRVKQIDKIRFEFLRGLFQDAGFDIDEAEARARLLYYYVLGEHFTTNIEPMKHRAARLRQKTEVLTSRN